MEPQVSPGEARAAWARHFNDRGLEALEKVLTESAREAGGRFSFGDELTVA